MLTPSLELTSNAKAALAETVSKVLADTFQLYLKTHAFHWNVTGPQFPQLHALFAEQYTEMWNALDELAERVRSLGVAAPGNAETLIRLSTIASAADAPPDARRMVLELLDGHERLAARAREGIAAAEEAGDAATADLLTGRMAVHEKTAWMLRATAA
jgi:starvation-inducible DNA-binding protein